MSYTGVYDKTIFFNPANKYSVISVKTTDRSVPEKARDAYRHRDRMIRFCAVGYDLPRTDQVSMILDGEWLDGKNGCQLHVTQCEEVVPQTKEGVQGYLASKLIKGVGEKTAAMIVGRFGADALRVLEKEPERLLEIKGITEGKLADIQASYAESTALRDLMILLSPFKITPVAATKIYEHFGARSVEILRDNPFELCQMSGFGFLRVDAIVLKNGCSLNAPMRIQGAVYAALDKQREDNGHLFLTDEELLKAAMGLLNKNLPLPQMKVKSTEVAPVIEDMLLHGRITCSNGNYYPVRCFAQEDETALQIAKIISAPSQQTDIRRTLETVRAKLGVELSQRQTEAVYMAFRHNLSIITGSPGTGKTTVLKAVIEVFRALRPDGKILLAAPTGRASRRMAESTGITDAKTLHSALGLLGEDGAFQKDQKDKPIDAALIIVDEMSMMDMWLARQFFTRIGADSKVVLVGDADQLQSVGAGDVFRELIGCGLIPVTILNEIFRQKQDSLIAYNAQKINTDDTDFYYGNDFSVRKCKTQEEAAEHIKSLYFMCVQEYGLERVQILSPFRSTGAASVEQLNEVIRETINPPGDDTIDLKVGGVYFRNGDKIMQNKNNAKASNGDIGFIRQIARDEKNEIKILLRFFPDREVEYRMADMEHIELAYATTVHKAQGSEFDVVIFPIIKSHAMMLTRSLVYTAITRAKCKVILVGQLGMLFMAVHKNDTGKRNTMLGKRIGLYVKAFSTSKRVSGTVEELEQLKKIS
ncbi:MAG: ATP-dependent RecD-like DNA helicase [Oscillospiraceae bacterium]|nr:ATP-dependent RecD-like DNA helicase [Oscillospiraceae bacterium]